MLHEVVDGVRKHYYDPSFRGIDLAVKAKAAEQEIQKANSNSQIFATIADVLDGLNDSHTFFEPPARSTHREFGFVMSMAGDDCYITNVRPRTDATEKLAPGDRVLTIQGLRPQRSTLWKMNYAFNQLYAVTVLHLQIVRPDGTEKAVDVAAKIKQEKRVLDLASGDDLWQLVREDENAEHLMRQRQVDFGDKLIVWKMPEFDMTDEEVDRAMKAVKRAQTLILDLRDNPGGAVKTLQYLVGDVMDHDVTIAVRKGRKPDLKPIVAKKRPGPFTGKVIVLVDNRSASASELFARIVQLEHRGVVLGDLSSGSVMESQFFSMSDGADTKIYYGASITDADLVMADGKSLEHSGVMPDERILPTAADLAAGRDPVLAKAAKLAGVDLDPVAAGKLFPYEWAQD
ncbi:MAG TPA: S41 family peptidase [Bryobacteraceae bacterium]|jgi:carboxyl-terminal processing protease